MKREKTHVQCDICANTYLHEVHLNDEWRDHACPVLTYAMLTDDMDSVFRNFPKTPYSIIVESLLFYRSDPNVLKYVLSKFSDYSIGPYYQRIHIIATCVLRQLFCQLEMFLQASAGLWTGSSHEDTKDIYFACPLLEPSRKAYLCLLIRYGLKYERFGIRDFFTDDVNRRNEWNKCVLEAFCEWAGTVEVADARIAYPEFQEAVRNNFRLRQLTYPGDIYYFPQRTVERNLLIQDVFCTAVCALKRAGVVKDVRKMIWQLVWKHVYAHAWPVKE